MSALPVNIATIRHRWAMSQAAFGALLGASRSQASNWERGRTAPTLEDMLRLAQITGISADRLHTSVLPLEAIPPAPLHEGAPAVPDDPIRLELKQINDQLGEIRAMLSRLIP